MVKVTVWRIGCFPTFIARLSGVQNRTLLGRPSACHKKLYRIVMVLYVALPATSVVLCG
jgi:hypothetical protein